MKIQLRDYLTSQCMRGPPDAVRMRPALEDQPGEQYLPVEWHGRKALSIGLQNGGADCERARQAIARMPGRDQRLDESDGT